MGAVIEPIYGENYEPQGTGWYLKTTILLCGGPVTWAKRRAMGARL